MSKELQLEILNNWVNFNAMTDKIINELETALKEQNNISLKEFYVMYYLSQETDRKLRLQQLQELIGLSQSAMSRLVGRLEAKTCGSLERSTCEDDKRGIYTSLTQSGEERFGRALQTFNLAMKEIEENQNSIIFDILKNKVNN
ncbi:MarR family winged helix-turn-helix transcriptional regulator [Bacillus pumilus]|uniref:MarR family transcriptional regulator n=1 Tax=Bacillus pumilus (strain SAFR-032) TaxID=315750 RepID=A8FDS7_BACP2|nr:MarR family transcriptional regulator [Bacillus pumilus]ABV62394.1 MarR family transcriptional regulator [Bacillus pumilus SAFR-032]AVI41150.1 MarR family transcriptional regulator [Bacillus pumilus]MBC3643016.1 MarR family transcriptional regulator [Bacillus pumilus]MBC3645163.1 MarR family transcriptional regulator [Bacillus pumilus]MBC3648988.1 MarR family transcriptional regulator [Bacillus pumilus]